jgi:hypothetical protein
MGKHKKDKTERKKDSDSDEETHIIEKKTINKDNIQDNEQDLKNESTSRPRGRPRKILPTSSTQQKNKTFDSDSETEKSPIALHIPLYDDSSSEVSEKNEFTMKDEDSEDEKTKKDQKLIMYLTDDDSDDEYNVKNLKKKLKKKDELIKKLKCEMNNKSDCYNDTNFSFNKKKDPNVNLLKMKLYNKDCICTIGEKTKFACWWCTCNFENPPCFIPEKYNNDKYFVFGCFCSYNCALAYILKDDEYKVANRVSLIKRLYAELYETDDPLYPSPPRELLNKFGGPMTTDEYKNSNKILDLKEYKMKFTNIIQNPIYFEESKKECDTLIYKK